MKKGKIIAVFLAVTCVLTGCIDQMPDLTQEESELIAEYAGDLLLKYSPNYNYRITDLEDIEEVAQTQENKEDIEIETESETERANTEEIHTQTEIEEQSSSEVEEVDKPDIYEVDLAELIGLEGFSLNYDSYEVVDAFPKNSVAFQVAPSKGKQLLVIHFTVKNESDQVAKCDMFECNPDMKVKVDGKNWKIKNTLLSK